jgi:hypothetical protein
MEKFTHGEKEKMENWVMEIDGEFIWVMEIDVEFIWVMEIDVEFIFP